VAQAGQAYENFDHAKALEVTETLFWTFTDDYLELVKERAYTGEGQSRISAVATLRQSLEVFLRLLAPVIPFATEEVWSWTHEDSIHRSPWPVPEEITFATEAVAYEGLLNLASQALITIRRAKTDHKVAQKTEMTSATLFAPALLRSAEGDLKAVGKIGELVWETSDTIDLRDVALQATDDQ